MVRDALAAFPVSGATVTVLDSGGLQVGHCLTPDHGDCVFSLPYGTYQVVISAPGYDYQHWTNVEVFNCYGCGVWSHLMPASPDSGTFAGQVRGPGNAPVPNAEISLINRTGASIFAGRSGADGSFTSRPLPPGHYSLQIHAHGYISASATVKVAARATVPLDFSLNATELAGWVLTGPSRRPVPGALIEVFDAEQQAVASTTSGADGRYLFTNLPPGQYSLKGSASGYGTAVIPTVTVEPGISTRYNTFGLRAASHLVGVRLSDAAGVRFSALGTLVHTGTGEVHTYRHAPGDGSLIFENIPDGSYRFLFDWPELGVLSPQQIIVSGHDLAAVAVQTRQTLRSVSGLAVDANSNPLPNLPVIAENLRGDAFPVGTTDASGAFTALLPDGRFVLTVTYPYGNGSSREAWTDITLDGDEVRDVTLRPAGGTLSVHMNDPINLDPIAGAHLTVNSGGYRIAECYTDEDGVCHLSVYGDPLSLNYSAPGYRSDYWTGLYAYGGRERVDLRPARYSPTPGTVTGYVRRSVDNSPIEGASLTLIDASGEAWWSWSTGASGAYRYDLAPGTYRIRAQAAGTIRSYGTVTVTAGASATLDLLLDATRLTGVVLTGPEYTPVPGALVEVISASGATAGTAVTGPDGVYTIPNMPPGGYVVRVSAPGFATAWAEDVEVTGGYLEASTKSVVLSPAGAPGTLHIAIDGGDAHLTTDSTPVISGTTTAPDGTAVAVRAGTVTYTASAAQGRWTAPPVRPLQPGTYAVTATVSDPAGQTANVGQVLTVLPLVLQGRATTEGAAGLPVTVSVLGSDGQVICTYLDLADETFQLVVPEPGTYRIRAERPGWLSSEAAVVTGTDPLVTVPPINLTFGDINGDGAIDRFDLDSAAATFHRLPPGRPEWDLNGNGRLDLSELALIAHRFGESEPE